MTEIAGWVSPKYAGKLQQLQDDLAVIRPQTTVDTKLRRCPCCKT